MKKYFAVVVLALSLFLCQSQAILSIMQPPYKLSLFDQPETYDNAKVSCTVRNAKLAEISNNGMQDAVFSLIKSNSVGRGSYYIEKSSENYWNKTEAQKRNRREELCITITSSNRNWTLETCTTLRGYICQSDLNPRIYVGNQRFTVMLYNNSGAKIESNHTSAEMICNSTGERLASIKTAEITKALTAELTRNADDNTRWTSVVYNVGPTQWLWADGTSIPANSVALRQNSTKNCLSISSTTYQWVATACEEKHPFICQTDIGRPNIIKAESENCSEKATISLIWKSNKKAIGLIHRIAIIPINTTNNNTVYRYVTADIYGGIQTTTIVAELEELTEYNVTISVCTDHCLANLSVSIKVTTAAEIRRTSVKSPVLGKLSRKRCFAYWEKPERSFENQVKEYKVTVKEYSIKNSTNTATTRYNVSNKKNLFCFTIENDLYYTATIQTKTCIGLGPAVTASGVCTGSVDEVFFIAVIYPSGVLLLVVILALVFGLILRSLFGKLREQSSSTSMQPPTTAQGQDHFSAHSPNSIDDATEGYEPSYQYEEPMQCTASSYYYSTIDPPK